MIKINIASDVDRNRFTLKESNKGVSRPIGFYSYIEVKWSCYFLTKIARNSKQSLFLPHQQHSTICICVSSHECNVNSNIYV